MHDAELARDPQTVTPQGERILELIDGVVVRDLETHVDDRGMLFELFNPSWGVHPDPLVYAYCTTVRPGAAKGWAVHREHEDRYTLVAGEAMVVLYDERPDSPTNGLVSEMPLTEYRRQLLTIPAGVWHATQNLGRTDVVIVNFPTKLYRPENPDKFRVPLDDERIPYRFKGVHGW